MKFVVPAGNCYFENIVDELEEVGDSVGLIERLRAFLILNEIVILLLLSHDAQDD